MAVTAPNSERVVAILEAACRVAAREGAHGLRMGSVAQEANVSKALVHYYFATRRDLLRSAFSWADDRWDKALDEKLAKLPTGAQKLEWALLMSLDPKEPFAEHRALWNEVWSSLRFDDELRPLVVASYRAWLSRLAGLVEEGRGDASIAPSVDAKQAASRLSAVSDGIDAMLYLGLLGRAKARTLMRETVRRELV